MVNTAIGAICHRCYPLTYILLFGMDSKESFGGSYTVEVPLLLRLDLVLVEN